MRKTTNVLFGLFSACCAFSLLTAQTVRADDKPVMLVHKDKVGDALHLAIKLSAEAMGAEIKADQKTTSTIKEIKKNGDVVTESKDEGGKISIGGMEMDQPPGPSTTTTRTSRGKLVDWKIEKEDESFISVPLQRLLDALNDILLPDKAVNPGDKWETEIANPVQEAKKIKVKTTYVGTEKVDGVELWKLKQTAEAIVSGDGDKISHVQTVWLNPTNGQLVRAEQEVKDIPTNTPLNKLSWKMKIEAVKPDKDAR